MVSEAVGFDGGKLSKGRKRFLTGIRWGWCCGCSLLLQACGEREGARVPEPVKQMGSVRSAHDLGGWGL